MHCYTLEKHNIVHFYYEGRVCTVKKIAEDKPWNSLDQKIFHQVEQSGKFDEEMLVELAFMKHHNFMGCLTLEL